MLKEPEDFPVTLEKFFALQEEFPSISEVTLKLMEDDEGLLHGHGDCFKGSLGMYKIKELAERKDSLCPICIPRAPLGPTRLGSVVLVTLRFVDALRTCETVDPASSELFKSFAAVQKALNSADSGTAHYVPFLKEIKSKIVTAARPKYGLLLARLRTELDSELLYPMAKEALILRRPRKLEATSEEFETELNFIEETGLEMMARQLASHQGWSLVYLPLPEYDKFYPSRFSRGALPEGFKSLLDATHLNKDVYLLPLAAAFFITTFLEKKYPTSEVAEAYVGLTPNREAADTAAALFEPFGGGPFRRLSAAYESALEL